MKATKNFSTTIGNVLSTVLSDLDKKWTKEVKMRKFVIEKVNSLEFPMIAVKDGNYVNAHPLHEDYIYIWTHPDNKEVISISSRSYSVNNFSSYLRIINKPTQKKLVNIDNKIKKLNQLKQEVLLKSWDKMKVPTIEYLRQVQDEKVQLKEKFGLLEVRK